MVTQGYPLSNGTACDIEITYLAMFYVGSVLIKLLWIF